MNNLYIIFFKTSIVQILKQNDIILLKCILNVYNLKRFNIYNEMFKCLNNKKVAKLL